MGIAEDPLTRMERERDMREKPGKILKQGARMAGDALRTAFGGGAITGESVDRRSPTEEMVMGNPMAHPMAGGALGGAIGGKIGETIGTYMPKMRMAGNIFKRALPLSSLFKSC